MLEENLKAIRKSIDKETSPDSPVEIELLIIELSSLLGLSSECLALAKKKLKEAQLEILREQHEKNPDITGNKLKMIIDTRCADEDYLLTYADRLNAGLVHKIDGLRSVLSYEKQSMEFSKYQK